MVRIMHLVVQIQRRQRHLRYPPFLPLLPRSIHARLLPEVGEDVRRLADDEALPILPRPCDSQSRRREGGRTPVCALRAGVHADLLDGVVAVCLLVGDVGVGDAGAFEEEADVFGAAPQSGAAGSSACRQRPLHLLAAHC